MTYGSDAMYKKTEYKNYVKRLETWLPTTIVSSQKHEDANEEYASTTLLYYDEKGQVVQRWIMQVHLWHYLPLTSMILGEM